MRREAKLFVHLSKGDKEDIVNMSATHTRTEIAKYIGCSRAAVIKVQEFNGVQHVSGKRPWTKEEDEQLTRYVNEGHSTWYIRQQLNRSYDSIMVRISNLRARGADIRYRMPGKKKSKAS